MIFIVNTFDRPDGTPIGKERDKIIGNNDLCLWKKHCGSLAVVTHELPPHRIHESSLP